MKWESIYHSTRCRETYMRRLKVPGGWFVKTLCSNTAKCNEALSVFFYPDPKHEWDGKIED